MGALRLELSNFFAIASGGAANAAIAPRARFFSNTLGD